MALSEELTIRDDEIAHLKSDVKKLEKKLLSLEGKGCRIPKVLSNITNVNEVTKALLEKKELEIKCLWTKLWDETEKAKHFEALLKFAEKEKDDISDEIDKRKKYISLLESNQVYFIQQQENCTCPKKSKESDSEEDEVGDMQASSTDSNEFLSRSESTFAEELGQLQSNVNNDSNLSIRKIPVEFDSPIRVPNTDFVLLRKMIQNLVGLIQRKNYGSDVQSLIKLENELGDAKCIQQIILAVNYIINSLKLSKSNVPNRKSSDPRVKALIIEKRGLDTENKSLKQELNDINTFLEVKEVELQVVKNECKELQSLNKELNEKIDKVHKEAEEIGEKYEDAKKSLEQKGIELRKLMRLYMKLMESAVPDKSKSSSCDECKKLQQKIREMQSECSDKEQVIQELKSAKRNLESRVNNYVHQVKQLQHEKAELEFKNQRDFAFSCGTLSDREKVRLHYYNKAIAALNKEEKALQKKKKAERGSTIHSVSGNTYIMSGERNSTGESSTSVANRTIHSGTTEVAHSELLTFSLIPSLSSLSIRFQLVPFKAKSTIQTPQNRGFTLGLSFNLAS
ncbi:hypothetical protein TNCT_262271 [Trichonephila clavata]|uniref:Uncharacterized protein n=1 Tax=Trichonephila clavata TaxID=2740835 RepID=A0A8X6F3G6_TRICU|nr:hypothetical protein TNCT_262271 [Trichonephila clavata]